MEETKIYPEWYMYKVETPGIGFWIGVVTVLNPNRLTFHVNFLWWQLGYEY